MPSNLPHHPRKQTDISVKFWMPRALHAELRALARSRTVSLSALMRLVLSQYSKLNKDP